MSHFGHEIELPKYLGLFPQKMPIYVGLFRQFCRSLWPIETVSGSLSIVATERWGAGVETQKNVRGEIGGWGRVPFNEPYAPLLSTIYDGA